MKRIILFLITSLLVIESYSQSNKITSLSQTSSDELLKTLQGQHKIDDGLITFDVNNFQMALTWSRKDKMLGTSTGQPGKKWYDYSAKIHGTIRIEEIKQFIRIDYNSTNEKGQYIGFKIFYDGTDDRNNTFSFCNIVTQEADLTSNYVGTWRVGSNYYGIDEISRFGCKEYDGTKEIHFSFNIDKYYSKSTPTKKIILEQKKKKKS